MLTLIGKKSKAEKSALLDEDEEDLKEAGLGKARKSVARLVLKKVKSGLDELRSSMHSGSKIKLEYDGYSSSYGESSDESSIESFGCLENNFNVKSSEHGVEDVSDISDVENEARQSTSKEERKKRRDRKSAKPTKNSEEKPLSSSVLKKGDEAGTTEKNESRFEMKYDSGDESNGSAVKVSDFSNLVGPSESLSSMSYHGPRQIGRRATQRQRRRGVSVDRHPRRHQPSRTQSYPTSVDSSAIKFGTKKGDDSTIQLRVDESEDSTAHEKGCDSQRRERRSNRRLSKDALGRSGRRSTRKINIEPRSRKRESNENTSEVNTRVSDEKGDKVCKRGLERRRRASISSSSISGRRLPRKTGEEKTEAERKNGCERRRTSSRRRSSSLSSRRRSPVRDNPESKRRSESSERLRERRSQRTARRSGGKASLSPVSSHHYVQKPQVDTTFQQEIHLPENRRCQRKRQDNTERKPSSSKGFSTASAGMRRSDSADQLRKSWHGSSRRSLRKIHSTERQILSTMRASAADTSRKEALERIFAKA